MTATPPSGIPDTPPGAAGPSGADAPTTAATSPAERPEPIRAVPARHPGQWIAAAVSLVLAAMFVHMLVTNPAFHWHFMVSNMFRKPVLEGARTTILITILSMIIGVLIGIVVAVMRLSPNRLLAAFAWIYAWVFRAVPRYVLLIVAGNLGVLYRRFEGGVPFDWLILRAFGVSGHLRFAGVDSKTLASGFMAGLIGLSLSEGAYMAEIVRAGIKSVDTGQTEAAQALGMTRSLALRRIVLPQALRVIVPPTGNETIAMLKDTSLLMGVPISIELFFQLEAIGARTFFLFPMLVAACLWYLAMTSILMVGQHFLERRFERGFSDPSARARLRLKGGMGGA